MAPSGSSTSHSAIFSLLVVLMLCAVGVSLLHLSPLAKNLAIFAVAFLMAGLVVVQYMGLNLEGPIVKWVIAVPVLLFAILVILLMPDIAHVPVPFLKFH
jgi:caa(3)-type oxidase subunit IV